MPTASPRNVASVIAITTAVLVGVLLFFIQLIQWSSTTSLLGLTIGTAIVSFVITYWGIGYFITKKLRVIYKIISTEKHPAQPTINWSSDVLSTVTNQVQEHHQLINSQIIALENNTNYRQEFLGNVSHELRTPLFALQGYILTLIDGGIDDKEIHINYLKRAQRNVERLIHLVDDLQTVTQLEHETTALQLKKNNIVAIVNDVFHNLELEAHQLNVTLVCTVQKPLYVLCNKEKMEQVFVNLIMNAIKYSKPEGGKITVRFHDMDIKTMIEISDNGIGIAQHNLLRVFERFYRVDSHRARSQGGSGLGLAIVKHIIEAHQQHISVRSTVGEGTTFSFTLINT